MDLKLLNKLQSTDMVSLILKQNPGGILDYYIIGQTVSYSAICSGQCSGYLQSSMVCFNIQLGSIVPLIEKGFDLTVKYESDGLRFTTPDEKITISPLYVEYRDSSAISVISKYLNFNSALSELDERAERLKEMEADIILTKSRHDNLQKMQLKDEVMDEFSNELESMEQIYNSLKNSSTDIEVLNLSAFINIASAASRLHEVVNFCGTYAISSITDSYLLQKSNCPIMALQGQLLYTLLRDGGGKNFYWFDNELVYIHGVKDKTIVFITRYLPNTSVDSTIVTRGVVEEKYNVKLKSALELASLVRNKFSDFEMDMGSGVFRLTNSNGESIEISFEIEELKSIALNKILRGEGSAIDVTLSTIKIPKSVHGVLGLFKNNLSIFVKKNKVILQNDSLYLVFGR